MHNKKISLNTYLLFVSWVDSFLIILLHHEIIISYPNDKMDKGFFRNWVLHIPRHLRDLLWMERAWYSIAPIFFFLELAESNHFLLAHIPHMNESHDHGRPFKVVITISALSTSSSTASSCSLIWDTLVNTVWSLHSGSSHSLTGSSKSSSDLWSFLQIIYLGNQTLL